MKRYLGMVRPLTFVTLLAFVPWLPIYIALVLIDRLSKPLTDWKAREDLKEMTRARDSTESGLVSAQKQAKDQTRRLLEAEDQL